MKRKHVLLYDYNSNYIRKCIYKIIIIYYEVQVSGKLKKNGVLYVKLFNI